MQRLNVYVDGFNLYFGMQDAGYNNCKWLDIHTLATNIKESHYKLNKVKYFTSRISNNIPKQQRQNVYLDALSTSPVQIIYGQFRNQYINCGSCGGGWWDSKEKMTDVNIASHLLIDAYKDDFDIAFLVSGDSDLVPPVKLLRESFPDKKIIIVFPPERKSNELKQNASASFTLGRKKLESAQFPHILTDKYGNTLNIPGSWK